MWQKSGNQGDEWLLVQTHVTLQIFHQLILEATVGGEAGDIAIDDLSLVYGPCPALGNKAEEFIFNYRQISFIPMISDVLLVLCKEASKMAHALLRQH